MKKTFNVLFAAAAVLLVGCNKAENTPEEPIPGGELVVLKASINEVDTRATLAETDGAFAFEDTDVIKIWNGTTAVESVSVTPDGVSSATIAVPSGFDSEGTASNWFAALPSSLVAGMTASSVTLELPSVYSYEQVCDDTRSGEVPAPRSFCPMIGTYSTGGTIHFKQAGSIMRFRVQKAVAGSLTFTFPTLVTGEVTFTSVPDGDNGGILAANLVGGGHSITVTGVPTLTAGQYIFVTLPVPTGTVPNEILVTNEPDDASPDRISALGSSDPALKRAGGYKFGVSLAAIPEATFKVASDRSVVLAPGNLMAKIGAYEGGKVTNVSEWRFGGDLEVVGADPFKGNYLFAHGSADCVGKWVDLFSWQGASTPSENRAHGLVNAASTSAQWHGDGAESVYDGCWNTPGISITNGGTYSWRPLTKDEWDYMLTGAERGAVVNGNSNCHFARVRIDNVAGLLIFPDRDTEIWDVVKMGTVPNYIDNNGAPGGSSPSWSVFSSYNAHQAANMAAAGIAFIPTEGLRDGTSISDVGANGSCWTATSTGAENSSWAWSMNYRVNTCEVRNYYRHYGRAVRLVRDK